MPFVICRLFVICFLLFVIYRFQWKGFYVMASITVGSIWIAVGFIGQVIFGLRFVVQWIATERKRESVIPVAFWYLSLLGTIILLAYSIYLRDPVFIAGFSLNMIIYLRNLYFIRLQRHDIATEDTENTEEKLK